MKRIKKGGMGEIVEKKSRFIANVFSVDSEEMAQEYIENVKKKYWDARHNCFAYVCGKDNEIQRFSDNGEPSGTAGKPILEIIEHSGVRNCLIVVTRYFGGTLLGTGGLIRAYQAAARAGLDNSEIMQIFTGMHMRADIDYTNMGKLQYICTECGVSVLGVEYGENVHMELMVRDDIYGGFRSRVTDAFSGTVEPDELGMADYAVMNDGSVLLL